MTIVAQVTDTHVVDPADDERLLVDNNDRLARTVASINGESPGVDAVVGSGDLTNDARPGQHHLLAELLAPLQAPFLALPGNHDDRDALRILFPDTPWARADHASWVATVGEATLVGLDTVRPGEGGGELDDVRLAWLTETLAGVEGPSALVMHHPPFVTGIPWMDAMGFPGVDGLAEVLEAHPVDRVWCGHLHRPIVGSIAGIPAIVSPPTVHLVGLDLAPDAEVTLTDGPAGYQLHTLTDSGWATHTRYVHPTVTTIRPDWG